MRSIKPELTNPDDAFINNTALTENEVYEFCWIGKKASSMEAKRPVNKTMYPCREESVDWEATGNVYIEGDNLDALKLLQNDYFEKIKMIYIDPPYNTGNKFVYKDDFRTKKDAGNKETSARFHSEWCSMMYPRLLLARNLLSSAGVLLISIDDNEMDNLKKICNEVFGEANFTACFNWNTKKAAQGMVTQNMIVSNHEYILVYAKDSGVFKFLGIERNKNNGFSNQDNDPRGPWKRQYLQRLGQGLPKRELKDPKTGRVFCFETPYTQEKINRWIEEKRILFPKNASQYPVRKEFLYEYKSRQQLVTSLGLYATKSTTEKLYSLFDGKKVFTNPKPETLLACLVRATTGRSDIVLDFFSGSATTAHAVMQVNAEDCGKRRFIMIQMPEPCASGSEAARLGYKNISEIGKERIRRAGKKISKEAGPNGYKPDIGFKVYKIVSISA